MREIRRGAALFLNLLLLQFMLAGSGMIGCKSGGAAVAAHGAAEMPGMPAHDHHGGPCRLHSSDQRGDCPSMPSLPHGCAQSAACAAPASAPERVMLVSTRIARDEPIGVSDVAPASRRTAPEPPPPRA